jgi:hypothetical protein
MAERSSAALIHAPMLALIHDTRYVICGYDYNNGWTLERLWWMVGAVDDGWFDSRQGHEHVCFICDIAPKFRWVELCLHFPYSLVACTWTSLNRLVLGTPTDIVLKEWVDLFVGAVCEFVSPKEQVWIMLTTLCILCSYFLVTFLYASNRVIDINSNNRIDENGLVFRSKPRMYGHNVATNGYSLFLIHVLRLQLQKNLRL